RKLCLVREPTEQTKLAPAEVVAVDERDDAPGAAFDVERGDRVAAARAASLADDRLVLLRLRDIRIGVPAQSLERQSERFQLGRELGRMPRLGLETEDAAPLEVEVRLVAAEDLRGEDRDPLDDVVALDERRELATEPEEGRRALRLAPRRF